MDVLEPHVLKPLTGLDILAIPGLRASVPECVYGSRATDLTCCGGGWAPIPVEVVGWVTKYKQ